MKRLKDVNFREEFDRVCEKCKEPFRTQDENQKTCIICRSNIPTRFRRKTNYHYARTK